MNVMPPAAAARNSGDQIHYQMTPSVSPKTPLRPSTRFSESSSIIALNLQSKHHQNKPEHHVQNKPPTWSKQVSTKNPALSGARQGTSRSLYVAGAACRARLSEFDCRAQP